MAVLLLLLVPVVELFVMVRVGMAIGALNTIALLIVVGLVGVWLVKRTGLTLLRRMQQQLDQGAVPSAEVVEGFLVLLAGLLFLIPGFVSDAFGLLLLVPPVRKLIARRSRSQVGTRVARYRGPGSGRGPRLGGRAGGVHDVGSRDLDP